MFALSTPHPSMELSLLVMRMVPEDLLSQSLAIDVRVNLGGAYILMPQH